MSDPFYIFRAFDASTAVATVEWQPSKQTTMIRLPLDQNNAAPVGEKLDEFLRPLQAPLPRTLSISNVDAIMAIVQPLPPTPMAWEGVNAIRLQLLWESDWTQLPDAELTEAKVAEWRVYRRELRAMTASTTDLTKVVWPTPPAN